MHWSLGRNESPLANDQERRGYNICTQALEFCVRRLPLANGQEISGLQHLELCTAVWVRRLPLCQWARDKEFATSVVKYWIFVWQDSPLSNVKERSDYQHFSHALEFGWVRLPPC